MPDRKPHGLPLEDTIDRAVRQIMDVDARPGFERRVMHRLAARPSAARWTLPRLATTTAVLALLAGAALLVRSTPEERSVAEAPSSAATTAPASAPPTTRAPTGVQNTRSTATPDVRERRPPRPMRERGALAVANADDATAAVVPIAVLPALDVPVALAVHTIEQGPVNVPAIRMSDIDIPRLNVEALEPLEEQSRE